MKFLYRIFFLILLFIISAFSQSTSDFIYVDSSGKMRWTANDEEAYFFGVNYSTPFAFSYRALKNKSISHKEIIDMDVQQFKRLGLNAYRIHVWDREVSDGDGNLISNEHIELLDYLISKLIENDIYIILTPIAWWGTGWPMPDVNTPGFSTFYSKIESTTKPEVLKAHINYLKQFVNHKNKYTGNSYKDEKYVIAFEVFNEPNLPEDAEKIRHYVNATVKALRGEGITKPIFFNISENSSREQWEGVSTSNVEGVSFQWYPTGLVKYSELNGNFLPNVLSYTMPDFSDMINNKAKMVYEFDAADIGKSYMYPVMAHSFKEAGMQFAAMFCYDPTALAQYNSEYSTHYLNLLYTPQKALSFHIASYLFNNEKISEKKIEGTSVLIENVQVNYENDISILNTPERFCYSNDNNVSPVESEKLKHIAGYGNSKIIKYGGRGAYFLDKINSDLWRLELFPDAVWLKDPFGRNGLDEPVANLIWKSHKMKIVLQQLNSDFRIYSSDNESQIAFNYSVTLEPGVYFITNKETFSTDKFLTGVIDFDKIKKYGEFIHDFESVEIKNLTPTFFYENNQKKISIEIYSGDENPKVFVYLRKSGWWNTRKFEMRQTGDFLYDFELPLEISLNGKLDYYITGEQEGGILTFPGKLNVTPENWAFNPEDSYKLSILPASSRITVYDPERDIKNLILSNIWRYAEFGIDYTFDKKNEEELNIYVWKLKEKFPELAMQFYVGNYVENVNQGDEIEFEIRKTSGGPDTIAIRSIFKNSNGFERQIVLNKDYQEIIVPINKPEKFKYALLPRPYPTFLPYWFESVPQESNDSKNLKLESIQIAVPLPESVKEISNYGIKLKKINLVKSNSEERNSNNFNE